MLAHVNRYVRCPPPVARPVEIGMHTLGGVKHAGYTLLYGQRSTRREASEKKYRAKHPGYTAARATFELLRSKAK